MVLADVDIIADVSNTMRAMGILQTRLQFAGLENFLQQQVVPWLRSRAGARFAAEGDDVSGPWTPLSRATQMIRAKKGFPPAHPINKRTGEMEGFLLRADGQIRGSAGYASLNWPGNSGRTRNIDQKIRTAQGMTVGTPARPVLGLGQPDDIFINSQLLSYLLS